MVISILTCRKCIEGERERREEERSAMYAKSVYPKLAPIPSVELDQPF